MFGINNARRRAIIKEESAFDYANKISKHEPRQDIHRGGFISFNELRNKKEEHDLRQEETKIKNIAKEKIAKERKERLRPYENAIGSIIAYRPNKPSPLKAKAVRGIYHSPFRR